MDKKTRVIKNPPPQKTSEQALKDSPLVKDGTNAYGNTTHAPEQTTQPIIVNNIVMRSVDRTPKDVGNLHDGLTAAESIYYPNRTRLLDIYKAVELDGHLTGIWSRRVNACVNKKFSFVDKNNMPIDEVNELLKSSEFRSMMKLLMKRVTWGNEGLEFIPGDKFCFKEIPHKHIKPEKKVIAINQTDYDGIPYEDISNIWVIGDDRDLGLLLKAAFYVLLKKGNFSDWANYIECFGMPITVTKYDAYDEKTKTQLTNAIENISSLFRINMPKQADIEILDGKTSNGTGDLQDKFKNACNDELSVLILTVTETTKSSKSSGYAQSETQSDEQDEITEDDVLTMLGYLNSDKFFSILSSYGYPVEGGKFVVEEKMKVQDQLVRVQVLDKLKNALGLPLNDDELYETFGIEKPADYEAQKAKADIEEEEQETNPNPDAPVPGKKPAAKPQPAKPKNLTAYEKLLAKLSDFFDPARKD